MRSRAHLSQQCCLLHTLHTRTQPTARQCQAYRSGDVFDQCADVCAAATRDIQPKCRQRRVLVRFAAIVALLPITLQWSFPCNSSAEPWQHMQTAQTGVADCSDWGGRLLTVRCILAQQLQPVDVHL